MDSPKQVIPGLSLETARLVEFLKPWPVGEIVTYKSLSEVIGKDTQGMTGRSNLVSAVRVLARDYGQAWGAVRGVGVKRLDPVETLDSVSERTRRAGRQIFRARKTLGLVEYAALPIDKKREHDALTVLTGLARTALSAQKITAVSKMVAGDAVLPKREDVLRLIHRGEQE